jgi:tetratricopeptide (TPR) repeat protein
MRLIVPVLVASILGCAPGPDPRSTSRPELTAPAAASEGPAAGVEAVSFLGEPLTPPPIPGDFRAAQEALLAAARQRLDAAPGEPESWIWVGRRTAYLGRYREAIAVYGRALERFPDEPRLYRHRGHRYITTRRLDLAVADLSRAAELVRGGPDVVEPDGLPNALGIPTSTLQSNTWYHLGLAHYLAGDFETALAAYRECLAVSANPDMQVATSYWLYLTLGRLGRAEEAEAVLAPITPELEVIENHDYHRLLLAYRRLADAHQIWEEAAQDPGSVGYATAGYGLGAYHLIGGRPEKAREWFERVLESPAWAAFGYVAAEAELARP